MRHDRIIRAASRLATATLAVITLGLAGAVHAGQAPASPQVSKPAPAAAQAPTARSASLEEILKQLAAWDGGIESSALWKLRDYVYARKEDPARAECEAKLLAFLKTPATPPARLAVCRYLRVIAGDTAVPALQAMLKDDRSSDIALYVLQQMPGAAADRALLQSLSTTTGPTRVSIVAALGERHVADAVPALTPLLKVAELAVPAATALGAIGSDAASQALAAAYPGARAEVKPVFAGAIMKCAEKSAAPNRAAALHLYEMLAADQALPANLRRAATMGRISASGTSAPALVVELLTSTDANAQAAAVARVKEVFAPTAIDQICTLLPRLPEATQAQLLAVLQTYPRERVLSTVVQAARGTSAPVRLAALKALEMTGDASVVPWLADAAAAARGPEQAAVRNTLALLKGPAVDRAILALVGQEPGEAVFGELLLAIGERRIYAAKPLVARTLGAATPRTRSQALKALRTIGTPSDIPAVLDILVKTDDDTERADAEATTAALAQKILNGEGRAAMVRTRLMTEKDPAARAKLIAVLPSIGDNATLPLLRTALADRNADVSDAAVRALVAWPTGAARDDVFRLARDARNETHRLLAIDGLVRIIRLDRYRDPEAAVSDLRTAAGFSWRPEEQKLVLGALVQFPCQAALEMAKTYLGEASVRDEAQAAVEKITAGMNRPARMR